MKADARVLEKGWTTSAPGRLERCRETGRRAVVSRIYCLGVDLCLLEWSRLGIVGGWGVVEMDPYSLEKLSPLFSLERLDDRSVECVGDGRSGEK